MCPGWPTTSKALACALVAVLVGASARAQTVTLEKSEFTSREEIRIQWTHPPREDALSPDWSLFVQPLTEAQFAAGGVDSLRYQAEAQDHRSTTGNRGEYVIQPARLPRGRAHQRFVAAVADAGHGYVPQAQAVFTIFAPEVRPRPGHVVIVSEPPFVTGEAIRIATAALGEEDEIGLYKLPVEVSGGALEPGHYVRLDSLRSGTAGDSRELLLRDGIVNTPVMPGRYELHFVRELQYERFVIDSVPLTVEAIPADIPPALVHAPVPERNAYWGTGDAWEPYEGRIWSPMCFGISQPTLEGYEARIMGVAPNPPPPDPDWGIPPDEAEWYLTLYADTEGSYTMKEEQQVARWKLEPGVLVAKTLPLPIGTYRLQVERIETTEDGEKGRGEPARQSHATDFGTYNDFEIGFPPHEATLGVDPGVSYATRMRVEAQMAVRGDLLDKTNVHDFRITVDDRRAVAPPCFVHRQDLELRRRRASSSISDDAGVVFYTPREPGEYVVRLYAPMPEQDYSRLVDEVPITVSLPDAHLALVSPAPLAVGERMVARVDPGASYQAGGEDAFRIRFEPRGFLTPGGAKAYPYTTVRTWGARLGRVVEVGAELEGQAAEPPGPHLALLFYGSVLIDSVPFDVVDPEEPDYPSLALRSLDRAPSHHAPIVPRVRPEGEPCVCEGFDSLDVHGGPGQNITLTLLGPGPSPDYGEGTPITAVTGTTPFRAELRHTVPPTKVPSHVTLRWTADPAGVEIEATAEPGVARVRWSEPYLECPLLETEDPLVYRTEWYSLGATAPPIPEPLGSLGSYSPEASALIATELFAGRWEVAHTGGQFDGAVGVAVVAESGERAVLFLRTGDGQREYESLEMLATRDAAGGRHTLDVRFVDLGPGPTEESPADEVPAAIADLPDSTPIFVTELTDELTFLADEERLDVPVSLPAPLEPPDARFLRVQLMAREGGERLAGAWHRETVGGALDDGGQQTWSRGTRIAEVVPLEDQRPGPPRREALSLAELADADASEVHGLLNELDPAARTTTYPFVEGAAPEAIRHRTLFVYGTNLPQHAADALAVESGDPRIAYELVALPGEGHDGLFTQGWKKARRGADGASLDPEAHSALVLRATLAEGVRPGAKAFTLNGVLGLWHLDFADANAVLSFAHRWREDADTAEGEFQPTDSLYSSDTAYVILNETTALPHEGVALTLYRNDEPVASLWARHFESPGNAEYRSPPLRLIHRGRRFAEPPEVEGALDLEVVPGDTLSVELHDPTLLRAIPAKPVVTIEDKPSDLGETWKEALKRVAACYGEDAIDFETMPSEKADEYSRFILTENLPAMFSLPMWVFLKERKIEISRGDHAAALLIRDEFVKLMRAEIPRMRAEMVDEEKAWRFFLEARTSPLPFWQVTRVAGPQDEIWTIGDVLQLVSPALASTGLTAGIDDVTVHDPNQENVRELVLRMVDYPEQWGLTPKEAHLAAFHVMRAAYFRMLELAEGALARAEKAGDDDLTELMLLAGQDADVVIARLLPRLVRLPKDGNRLHWEPDFVAQAYVKSLKTKGKAVRALEEYGRVDDAYKAMAVAAVTAGAGFALSAGGAVLAGTAVALAGDMVDMLFFGTTDLMRAIESDELLRYAEGASLVLGDAFYAEARAQRAEWWQAAVGVLLPGVSGASNLGRLGSLHRAARGARLMGELDALTPAALAALDEQRLLDLGAYFTELSRRRPGSTGGNLLRTGETLNRRELADLARFDRFLVGAGVPPPPTTAPRGRLLADADAPTVRLDDEAHIPTVREDAETLRADATTVRESPPAGGDDPNVANAPPAVPEKKTTTFVDAEDRRRMRDRNRELVRELPPGRVAFNGEETPVDLGGLLGEGRTTSAFLDGAQPGARTFRALRPHYNPIDFQIDAFGDRILRVHEGGSNGLYRVPRRYAEWHVKSVSDPRYEPLVGAHVTLVDRAGGTAAERIAAQPDGITRGQLHALDQTTRYFNRRGIAWTDNHLENFDFEAVDEARDVWQLVIFDTGGFFPVRGDDPLTLYQNARAVQEAFNLPGEQWMSAWRAVQRMPAGEARDAAAATLRTRRNKEAFEAAGDLIQYEEVFGDGPAALIGMPMAMVNRDGYRGLASLPPDLADELTLRYWGQRSPVPAPADPNAPVRSYTPEELDEIERQLLDDRRPAGVEDFRDRATDLDDRDDGQAFLLLPKHRSGWCGLVAA